ncbi:fungal-specific transcription factor domain-containing protein [Xylariomycetidae sp. FL0641]|nr:fungal-specific transcription factor domain-containing protein [Xylariomycetidae sp. FL0641]
MEPDQPALPALGCHSNAVSTGTNLMTSKLWPDHLPNGKVYIVPLTPAAGEKKLYIRALEQRVAELESQLQSLGQLNVSVDHLGGLGQAPVLSLPHGDYTNSQPSQLSQTPIKESDDEDNDILTAVRDLSLSASGHYVGASSNITIGRVLGSVVQSQRAADTSGNDDISSLDEDDPAPKSGFSSIRGDAASTGMPALSPAVAARLLQGWFRHISTRYPVIHSARLQELHNHRESLSNEYDRVILYIVYAISGRWLESTGEMGPFSSNQMYYLAFKEMDNILRFRDSRTIDYLLLMALYCIRAPRDPGAWTFVGAALMLCIELGLHRRPKRPLLTVEGEMRKRRFWTAYFLDRDISIAVGRPPSISDHDIDAELPFDISEETLDDETVRQASVRVTGIPVNPPNSLTSFIHRTRLKRIESEIQHVVYRVDQPTRTPSATINHFLDQLNAWKAAIPYGARNYVTQQDSAYEGFEFYSIHYYRCVRFLLYPQLAETPVNMRFVHLCADACAGIIKAYRQLQRVFPVGFSGLSIQSVFLAGLTLAYCAWLAPMNTISIDGPLADCLLLMYIVTERYPSARKYRDIFERIKNAMTEMIAQGKHQPRHPMDIDPIQEGFTNAQGHWGPAMTNDFNFMIGTMTGSAVTPQFEMGPDPTALDTGVPGSAHAAAAVRPYQSPWPSMTGMAGEAPQDFGHVNTMGGIFQ